MASSGTFWVRADSITANNSVLNPIGTTGANGVPAFEIYFTNDDPDITGVDELGDLYLDVNGGLPDPDTSVVINGQSYPFTLLLIGTLPIRNSNVPDIYEGNQVALISVVINGVTHEYFFLLDGSGTEAGMNAFGNGAIALTGVDTNPPPAAVCFCAGTDILTPSGYRKVETLRSGDLVLNDRGEAKQLMWVGRSMVSLADLDAHPNLRPIRIPAGAIAPGRPKADLHLSPQHRVVIEGPEAELLFGEERVLVPAKHLTDSLAEVVEPEAEVSYYHLLLEDHEILVSNGLPSESFQPARRTIDVMSERNRALLEGVLEALGQEELLLRKDALLSLKRNEARVLADALARRGLPAAQAAQEAPAEAPPRRS